MILSIYRRRKRLQYLRDNMNDERLNYYWDPETATVYCGVFRYDPFLRKSFHNSISVGPDTEISELTKQEP